MRSNENIPATNVVIFCQKEISCDLLRQSLRRLGYGEKNMTVINDLSKMEKIIERKKGVTCVVYEHINGKSQTGKIIESALEITRGRELKR